jgi:uncharacterized protein YoxC
MLEKLSLKTRKLILFVSVFIISLAIIFLKLAFFSKPIKKANDDELGSSLKQFSEEVGEIFYESKQQFSEIKDKMKELVEQATSTPAEAGERVGEDTNTQSEVDIEKLKQELDARLREKAVTSTATTTD